MLGLGLGATMYPRPLHIFDNRYAVDFDGAVVEGIHIDRHSSMLSNQFTIGMFVGDCEAIYNQHGASKIFCSNVASGGFELTYSFGKILFSATVQHPTDASSQEIVSAESASNKMSFANGTGYGAADNFSTGNGGYNLIVGTFDGAVGGGAELKLYIGGGVSNSGNGMGNNVYLAGTNTADNAGSAVAYGSLSTDLGIACGDALGNGTSTNPTDVTVDQFFYFSKVLDINAIKQIYNNGQSMDLLQPTDNYDQSLIEYLQCYLRFEIPRGDGDTIKDTVGTLPGRSSQTATVLGSPTWVEDIPEEILT